MLPKPRDLRAALATRWSSAWLDAAASSVAAAIAWVLSSWFFGHPHPVFAAVSAIVCLAPGLPNRGRQAVGLMLGVTTGIVVGELALQLPAGQPLLRVSLACFAAMMFAAAFGLAPVVPIQAGVSAILVLAVGPAAAGSVRLLDVVVGACVGLTFSQILLTPDPVRQIERAARSLREQLAAGFEACANAARHHDRNAAHHALAMFAAAHDGLIGLTAGIEAARNAARWSLRGRLAAAAVAEAASRYDRRAIRLYASSLLFAESFAEAMRLSTAPAPEALIAEIEGIAALCRGVARPSAASGTMPIGSDAPVWRSCAEQLRSIAAILDALDAAAQSAPGGGEPRAG